MIIRIFFILFAVFGLSRVFVRTKRRELSYALATLAVLVWTSVVVFTLQPQWLDRIAEAVGIGRGVDTAVYISVLVIFYLLFRIFVRLEKMEDQLTTVVRKDAIEQYHASREQK